MPPLQAAITREEIEVVRQSSKNVYAPYMRKLIDFDASNFSVGFTCKESIGIFLKDLDVTNFTVQFPARLIWRQFKYERSRPVTPFCRDVGFVFRFDIQTGEGYCFASQYEEHSVPPSKEFYLTVNPFNTRSKLTDEPLQRSSQ